MKGRMSSATFRVFALNKCHTAGDSGVKKGNTKAATPFLYLRCPGIHIHQVAAKTPSIISIDLTIKQKVDKSPPHRLTRITKETVIGMRLRLFWMYDDFPQWLDSMHLEPLLITLEDNPGINTPG
jgi:hypothetical protein